MTPKQRPTTVICSSEAVLGVYPILVCIAGSTCTCGGTGGPFSLDKRLHRKRNPKIMDVFFGGVCVCVCDKNCCIDESCRTPSDRRSYDAQLLSLSLENVKHCANKSRLSVSMLRCLILGAGFEDLRWWHFFRFRKCWGFASVFFKVWSFSI